MNTTTMRSPHWPFTSPWPKRILGTSVTAAILLAIGMIGATSRGPLTQSAPRTCTDQSLITSAVKLISENNSPLFGHIEVLKSKNARTNTATKDGEQCLLDVVTNRGEMLVTYGWKTIDGDEYVSMQLSLKQ